MSLKTVISVSFVFVTVYALSILIDWTAAALLLVSLSPIMVLWVAYRTLKDPEHPEETFQDKFYEDYEYYRNQ